MRSPVTVSFLVRGAIIALLIITAGAVLSGPAAFGPRGGERREAALLNEVKKLFASDIQAGDAFGGSVAVSGDTAFVAAEGEGTTAGK